MTNLTKGCPNLSKSFGMPYGTRRLVDGDSSELSSIFKGAWDLILGFLRISQPGYSAIPILAISSSAL